MHLPRTPAAIDDRSERFAPLAAPTLIGPGSWRIAIILLVVAIAARAQEVGSAVVSIDEQF
ncbi:hypothetical protein [Sphingomonas mollis]|uniref:Uncharacterized protein n=1 Tax=Sphingomonas mollis TaxID=2795726 RepID=A0ABS0XUT5_9SPHN|nr:hypothetical protein [Sphingomonas sp. BT553]MBJ6123500.1 hypothetical protein [Sphingomonas sp. BT553]